MGDMETRLVRCMCFYYCTAINWHQLTSTHTHQVAFAAQLDTCLILVPQIDLRGGRAVDKRGEFKWKVFITWPSQSHTPVHPTTCGIYKYKYKYWSCPSSYIVLMCQTLETLGEQENRVQIIFVQYWVRVQNIVPSKKYRKKTSKKKIYNEKKLEKKRKKRPNCLLATSGEQQQWRKQGAETRKPRFGSVPGTQYHSYILVLGGTAVCLPRQNTRHDQWQAVNSEQKWAQKNKQ